MPTTIDGGTKALFLHHLAKRWPGIGETPAVRKKAQAFMRFTERVKQALEDAGYPEAVLSNDPRYGTAGYVLQDHCPDPFGRWAVVLNRADVPGADVLGWMGRYSLILKQAGFAHHVQPSHPLPGMDTPWGEIHIWMPPSEVES
jgi:hypothetical protein